MKNLGGYGADDFEEVAERLWLALKQVACADPSKAKCVVMVRRDDLVKALTLASDDAWGKSN